MLFQIARAMCKKKRIDDGIIKILSKTKRVKQANRTENLVYRCQHLPSPAGKHVRRLGRGEI